MIARREELGQRQGRDRPSGVFDWTSKLMDLMRSEMSRLFVFKENAQPNKFVAGSRPFARRPDAAGRSSPQAH